MDKEQAATATTSSNEALLHPWVVAVGASAGGLEPLQQFFSGIRAPSEAAFVVIQHLAPDHRSMMAELLGRHAHLPVREAVAGEALPSVWSVFFVPSTSMVMTCVSVPAPVTGLPAWSTIVATRV